MSIKTHFIPHQPLHLKVEADLSTTYVPHNEAEIEAVLYHETVLYHFAYDAASKRLEIIYKAPLQCIQGIEFYSLKCFSVEKGRFDYPEFKRLFKACFPEANVSTMTKREAKELCATFVKHIKKKMR